MKKQRMKVVCRGDLRAVCLANSLFLLCISLVNSTTHKLPLGVMGARTDSGQLQIERFQGAILEI
jgi:hypothetical protein